PNLSFFLSVFLHLALKGFKGVRRSPLHGNTVSNSFTHTYTPAHTHTHFLTVSHLMMLPYPGLHCCTHPLYVLRFPSLSLPLSSCFPQIHTLTISFSFFLLFC
uniref:Uncharacterized protein n=1 Tax=Xiphophorus maculatus TaxID=8083 RepID=A0A3B5QHS1_XIPMA